MPSITVFLSCVQFMSLEGLYFSVVRLQEGVDLGQSGGRGELEGVERG